MSLRPLPLLALLVLAGCTTSTTPVANPAPATPPARGTMTIVPAQPATPPPLPTDTRPATIKGSEESSTLLDNFTAFVTAIDGKPVAAGRKGWNEPISLPPGSHRLSVEFIRGSFFARTELALDAKPGASYEVRQTNDAQVYGDHTFCEFSIVDTATSANAAAPKRIALEKVKTGN